MEKGNAFQQMILEKLNAHVGGKKTLTPISYPPPIHRQKMGLRFQCKT